MLDEVGDAFEHVFEEAAFLAGADHAHGEFVEDPGMGSHGLGEAADCCHIGRLESQSSQPELHRVFVVSSFEHVTSAVKKNRCLLGLG